jgi:hypothetical protein
MKTLQRAISIVSCFAIVLVSVFWHERILSVSASETTDTFTSSGTWEAPAGVTSVLVECWGGGGGGGKGSEGNGGGGGGGGAYSSATLSVTPNNSYTVVVGAGGEKGALIGSPDGEDGGDSWFSSTSTLLAKGGAGGINGIGSGAGGSGGSAASGVGSTKFSGGNGAQCKLECSAYTSGGGGGGAGTTENGGSNAGQSGDGRQPGGAGGDEDGGDGGDGGMGAAENGFVIGGGGSGGSNASVSAGNGGRGECRITYEVTTPPPPTYSPQGVLYGDGSSTILSADYLVWDDTNNFLGVGTSTPRHTLEVLGTTATEHLKGFGGSPTIDEGACAGTGGSSSISGTDMAGEIVLETGTAPSGSSVCVTVTFAEGYGSAPRVTFSPSNENAGLMAGIAPVYVQSSTSTFTLSSTVGLLGSTAYKWNYQVVE